MNRKNDGCTGIRILSPLTGTAVALGEVPDPVFSQKIIGDGVAIIPRDGKLVSPIDGEVVSVAETLHAYGLRSKDGIEVMVHFGSSSANSASNPDSKFFTRCSVRCTASPAGVRDTRGRR